MNGQQFTDGDVIDYDSDRANNWCREGVAIIEASRTGGIRAVDTYWQSRGDEHVLNGAELATARLRFRMSDFEELARYSRTAPQEWLDRAAIDRATIPSQHGLSARWFIRSGSQVDPAMIRANLATEVDACQQALDRAARALEWAKEALDRFDHEQVSA